MSRKRLRKKIFKKDLADSKITLIFAIPFAIWLGNGQREKNLEKDLRDSKISLTFVIPFATKREAFLNWFFELLVIF